MQGNNPVTTVNIGGQNIQLTAQDIEKLQMVQRYNQRQILNAQMLNGIPQNLRQPIATPPQNNYVGLPNYQQQQYNNVASGLGVGGLAAQGYQQAQYENWAAQGNRMSPYLNNQYQQYAPRNQATGNSEVPITQGTQNVPLIGSNGLNVGNEIYAWSYVVFTFIIFTVALAVMRNLYRNYSGRKNIKKEIRKRMKRALGDDLEGEQGENFLRSDDGPNNNFGDEEEKKSGDGENNGGIKNYFKKALSKITKTEGDYEQLSGTNKDPDSNQHQGANIRIQAHEISYGQDQNDYESPVFPIEDQDQSKSSSNPNFTTIESNYEKSKENQGIMNRFFGMQKAAIQDKENDDLASDRLIADSQKNRSNDNKGYC